MRLAFAFVLLTATDAAAEPIVPFLEVAAGVGDARETAPELVDASPALVAHVVVGQRLGPYVTVGAVASLLHATYDNTFEAPVTTAPDERMPLTRGGIGLRGGGAVAAGPVELSAGAAALLFHTQVTASGTDPLLPVAGEYDSASDTGVGFEVFAGAAVSPWPCGRGGVRVTWTSHRAELGGDVDLGGLAIELFVQVDLVRSPTQAGGSRPRC